MSLSQILYLTDSPGKTAALVEWVQGLYEDDATIPVLVGGAAVELLTGGAYTTGDLDFAGSVPESVASKLAAAGFEKKGRHWIHSQGQIFLEFPSDQLEPVDRLAAWQFWNSTTDAANAFLILRATGDQLDKTKLRRLVAKREVSQAWKRLRSFDRLSQKTDPTPEELEEWATASESW